MVEGLDGAPDLVVAPRLHARVQIARRQFAQPGGQLLDGPADAVRQVDQQRQRHQPDRRGQQDVGELDAAAQIARVRLFHGAPRIADLARQAIHRDIAQALRVDPDLVAVAHQIVQAVAILAGAYHSLTVQAARENLDRVGPRRTIQRPIDSRLDLAGARLALANRRWRARRARARCL